MVYAEPYSHYDLKLTHDLLILTEVRDMLKPIRSPTSEYKY